MDPPETIDQTHRGLHRYYMNSFDFLPVKGFAGLPLTRRTCGSNTRVTGVFHLGASANMAIVFGADA